MPTQKPAQLLAECLEQDEITHHLLAETEILWADEMSVDVGIDALQERPNRSIRAGQQAHFPMAARSATRFVGTAFDPLDSHKPLRGHSCPNELMGIDATKAADLLQGTLELLILRTLAAGEKHGYEIAEWIHVASAEALSVEEGALYPALHRLELRGLLTAEWDVSDNNRRAKYYRLTASGRKRLKETTESWRRASTAINRVLEAT